MTDSALGGRLDGKTHRMPMRVYYADTDAGGVVYHANYLTFAERARTEILRQFGLDHARLKRDYGLIFAVHRCQIDFLRPAYLDDLIEVRSTLNHLGGASLGVNQSIRRRDEELVKLKVRLAGVGAAGRPIRLPAAVRIILGDLLEEAN
jgi:acyl-CoA thioester hydrolase